MHPLQKLLTLVEELGNALERRGIVMKSFEGNDENNVVTFNLFDGDALNFEDEEAQVWTMGSLPSIGDVEMVWLGGSDGVPVFYVNAQPDAITAIIMGSHY